MEEEGGVGVNVGRKRAAHCVFMEEALLMCLCVRWYINAWTDRRLLRGRADPCSFTKVRSGVKRWGWVTHNTVAVTREFSYTKNWTGFLCNLSQLYVILWFSLMRA